MAAAPRSLVAIAVGPAARERLGQRLTSAAMLHVVLGSVLVAAACGTSHTTPPTTANAGDRTAVSDGAAGDAGPGVTAPGGGRVVIGPATARAAPTAASSAGGAKTAARQALDGWLAALGHRDAATMLADSTGAAAGLGSINLVAQQAIASRGGTTDVEVSSEALTPGDVGAAAVTFTGEIDLRTAVTGPKGTTTSQDRITGPIRVVNDRGTWRVATFAFDGMPLVYYPEGATQTVSGLRLDVALVLSYIGDTIALVAVHPDNPGVTVTLQRLTLTTASGAKLTGSASFPAKSPTGLFTFSRTAERPTRLDATFQERNGPAVNFSLALPGQPL